MDAAPLSGIEAIKEKINKSELPDEIRERLLTLLAYTPSGVDLARIVAYIEFAISLPFNKFSEDILDLNRAKQILDKNHYGLGVVKDRILEYLSVLILHKTKNVHGLFHAPILAFIGLVGTGKTSIAYSIAESLGRPIVRIPFGGLGDPEALRGQSRVRVDAEPGLIIKAVKNTKVSNPVILLDEIDRVAQEARIDIMGVLVELLDPAQNQSFVDHYLDFPYNLSQVLFIATANNTANIATAVMDRIEPIQMPAYSDEEKMVIGRNYLLLKALDEAGVDNNMLVIDENVWPQIIRPLGFDAGIRSLQRSLQSLCRKVARQIVEKGAGPFRITTENVGGYVG
ncbi:hypothetical protein A3B45_01445 [Candidatus Daviesbacteria bacterium RIFCSPLOWO2_01_FULL_39_12]|uniref:AAA+ ATPase domain-containing protein n=1 Tax=Candidatus Daviesbacteria bacterium RIFCSPLOWO2_01_FULL_39_12 TaxID=1797785 RepID=A0A1F5KQH2_9BACT|nr:MAG: hypothetical protein A3D79_03715 [Candidatus Daviesbacteria bacterium RIFCSPHIGHO2_02_FULL_39_8]OGE43183.1 MAG: hypothetical protein A3B45_01445 [Candidatus Daviesbacteria bacterium RIFCSPLOWO2_01_FULL_39_12]